MPSAQQPRTRDTEPLLTAAVVTQAEQDGGLARGIAKVLLDVAATQVEPDAAMHAHELRRYLPRTRISLKGESPHLDLRLRSLFQEIGESRVDWLFLGTRGFALAVEVKINPKTRFQPKQLKRTAEVLRSRGYEQAGVLALLVRPPKRSDLLRSSDRKNLGFVLWSDVEPSLRALTAVDDDQWRRTLDAILALRSRR